MKKSFISPCKQINTDALFRNIHLHSANFHTYSANDSSERLKRSRIIPTSCNSRLQSNIRTMKSNTSKQLNSNCLKLSDLFGGNCDANQRLIMPLYSPTSQQSKARIAKLAASQHNSRSFDRASKQNDIRPTTSYHFPQTSLSDSVQGESRPITGALNVRIKMLTSAQKIIRTEPMDQEIPMSAGKIYIPTLWKRLKTLKKRQKRNRIQDLQSIIVGVKVM